MRSIRRSRNGGLSQEWGSDLYLTLDHNWPRVGAFCQRKLFDIIQPSLSINLDPDLGYVVTHGSALSGVPLFTSCLQGTGNQLGKSLALGLPTHSS